MRVGWTVVGVVLLVIGLATLLYGLTASTTASIPPPGSLLSVTPQVIGSGTVYLSWSGGNSSTVVQAYVCPNTACTPIGARVASAHGASGSISFAAQGGQTYAFNESGSSSGLPVSVQVGGFTILLIIGIVLGAIGGLLLGVGLFAPRKEGEAAAEAPVREILPEPAPAPMPTYDPSQPAVGQVMYAPPPSAAPAAPPPPSSGISAPAGGGRAMIQCPACGTMNEPWLTNCRWCKRTLMQSTSSV